MKPSIKKIAFLVAKPGLSDAAFRYHWREIHGPLVAGSPGYRSWRLRYVQNHVMAAGPVGSPFAFAGMAEFWLPGSSPNEDAFSATDVYRDRIAPDERNFIDMNRTISFAATEQVLNAGKAPVKVITLSRRPAGLDEAGQRMLLAQMVSRPGRISPRGWRVDHAIAGTFRLPGAAVAEPLAIDCMESLWFDSENDMHAHFRETRDERTHIFTDDGQMSFIADEYVFHDLFNDR
ncbi:EthD domain-containing protein [Chelatococcus asaccharovorans]|mgnify:CR=1 FL=1|uniref:EthD domain-containing protein n=1 Tax=Chelatococcus asaccharovorans TaxID=28210 RepID=UPI0022653A68|nr:EthD domain-containing protein [Chelatococcus asaccharovorans]